MASVVEVDISEFQRMHRDTNVPDPADMTWCGPIRIHTYPPGVESPEAMERFIRAFFGMADDASDRP